MFEYSCRSGSKQQQQHHIQHAKQASSVDVGVACCAVLNSVFV